MNLQIALIRNGKTQSSQEGRFMGISNEGLSEAGEAELERFVQEGRYPGTSRVFVSPIYRCVQTARILYPNGLHVVSNSLRAFDFGEFEGKTYKEVISDKRFARWADSPYLLACPGGEEPHDFSVRCVIGFEEITRQLVRGGIDNAVIITHQNVVKAVLKRFCLPRSAYVAWNAGFGGGYLVEFNASTSSLHILKEL